MLAYQRVPRIANLGPTDMQLAMTTIIGLHRPLRIFARHFVCGGGSG